MEKLTFMVMQRREIYLPLEKMKITMQRMLLKNKQEDDDNNYIEVRIDSVLTYKGVPNDGASAKVSVVKKLDEEVIDLQAVLTAGNVADKSIVLTNATDDALLLSPEEGRIMIGGKDDAVPKLELRHSTGILDTSLVALELDEDGKRFDIECDERVDNIHFRFNNDDKLVLHKEGDAEFTGRVKAEPGRKENEVVTYQQLLELEEEIEQLLPTTERGTWQFKNTCSSLDAEFCMTSVKTNVQYDKEIEQLDAELSQCLVDSGGDPIASGNCSRVYQEKVEALIPAGTKYNTDDFSLVTEISFASVDVTGTIHSFSDVQVGEIIDLLSEDGGYMVAEITKAPTGLWYEDHKIGVKVTSFKGKASGRCRIKVFSISEDLDPQEFDNFVRKSGDTITGTLTVEPVGNVPSLGVHPSKDASSGKYVIYTYNKNNEFAFFVTAAGNVGVSSSWSPTRDYYLAPKKYVDDAIKADKKPAGFDFNYKSMTDGKNIEEAKSLARVDGQFSYYGANSEYYLFINRFDYYKRVNISPYYDDGTNLQLTIIQ